MSIATDKKPKRSATPKLLGSLDESQEKLASHEQMAAFYRGTLDNFLKHHPDAPRPAPTPPADDKASVPFAPAKGGAK